MNSGRSIGIGWNQPMIGPCLGFRRTEQNTLDGDAAKSFHSLGCSAVMESVSGFCQDFTPRNLEGSRPTNPGRLHRIEHRTLPKPPQRDAFTAATAYFAWPSDTLVGVRPAPRLDLMQRRNRHAVGSQIPRALSRDDLAGVSFSWHCPADELQDGRNLPPQQLPRSILTELTLGRAASFSSTPSLRPASDHGRSASFATEPIAHNPRHGCRAGQRTTTRR